jgi:hypothetical protein
MKTLEIIAKIGKFFTVVAVLFTVLVAIVAYLVTNLLYPSAPLDFKILTTLNGMLPYLFVAVLSIVVAVVCWGVTKEAEIASVPQETEVPPEKAPAAETA